ncbi:MAG: hypothetical protein HDR31_01840, partial [Mycoplasma sp.]|nr:hypothetical protein [Mycoplasma sp.]
ERTDFKKIEDHEIGYFIERVIEESIVESYCPNSDIIYNNLAKKLKIIVTKDNVVKTIINNLKK